MRNWKRHWENRPKLTGKTDYLQQVGKTVKGQPITDLQFQLIVSEICDQLQLEKDDIVLDLCCGNGLITKELARHCKEVVGIDFSQPLLEVANRDHRPTNVSYQNFNILDLDKMPLISSGSFSKILINEALQFVKKRELIAVLRNILRLSSESCTILIGGIPEMTKKWEFYNTPKRRLMYCARTVFGNEAIGTWWDKEFIRETCRQLDLLCEFREQRRELHTSHYRFDVLISRNI